MAYEFLAEFLGTYIMAVSIVFLIRYEAFLDYVKEFADNMYMRYNVAFAELGVGLAIILFSGSWTLDYRGVITVLGWLMFLEAIFHFLATEEQEEHLIQKINQDHLWKYYGLLSLTLGLYLITKGFAGF
jgi:hypothetical protein